MLELWQVNGEVMLPEKSRGDSAGKIERSAFPRTCFKIGLVLIAPSSGTSLFNGDVVASKRSQMHDLFFGSLGTRQFARYPAMAHDQDPVGQG